MSQSLIEKIARGLCKEDGFDPDIPMTPFSHAQRGPKGLVAACHPDLIWPAWRFYVGGAAVVLDILSEPTEVMKEAFWNDADRVPETFWPAMIEAARKDGGGP